MRVAVLAHSFPRFRCDTHGPFVKHLSEALAELGHRVDVLVPFDPEIREDPETPLTIDSFRYVWPDRWHLLGYSRTLKRDTALRAIHLKRRGESRLGSKGAAAEPPWSGEPSLRCAVDGHRARNKTNIRRAGRCGQIFQTPFPPPGHR